MKTTDTTVPAAVTTQKPTKLTNARVEALIASARQRGAKLIDRNPALAGAVVEAGEKNASAEQARQAARDARAAARKLRQDQRAADQATRQARRDERKAATAAKQAAKAAAKAAKSATKSKKIMVLSDAATAAMDSLASMNLVDLMALNAALTRVCKERSVSEATAAGDKPEPGDEVEIIAGDHVGKTGVVTRAQRVRCFVKLNDVTGTNGVAKEAYLYITQVKVTTPAPKASAAAPEAAA